VDTVMTYYRPLELRPGPRTPAPPNSPPRPSWAWTTTQSTTLATPGHHHLSPPPATAIIGILLAITAMITTSVLALAITPPVITKSAPALAISGTSPTAAATSAPAPETLSASLVHAETPITHHDHASPPT
ncbi:hypothetical protein C0993_001037, partial [Termitomyces sp. T159_Od127]